MTNSKKRMERKPQRILLTLMAMFMVACAFWTSADVVKAASVDINLVLTEPKTTGFSFPGGTTEETNEVEADFASNEFYDYGTIRKGVNYNLDVYVKNAANGRVSCKVEGTIPTWHIYTDISIVDYDAEKAKTRFNIYVDPKDSTKEIILTLTSAEDPSVSKEMRLTVWDNEEPSISAHEGYMSILGSGNSLKTYVKFDGKSRAYVMTTGRTPRANFNITGEMNDELIELSLVGNHKPVKWFDQHKDSYGHTQTYLFSIDPEETSDHLVLTASLRAHPECKAECHYYLAPDWIRIEYLVNPVYKENVVTYYYPAGEEFMLANGEDVLVDYLKNGWGLANNPNTETITGWMIGEKEYKTGETLIADNTVSYSIAKAVWVKDPIKEEPIGLKVDLASQEKSVSISTPVIVNTNWLGDKAGWSIYLEKYDEFTASWKSTKLSRTERQDFFEKIPNCCLIKASDRILGYTELVAGVEPSAFALGTYRYRIINANAEAVVSESFNVSIKAIVTAPEDQTFTCGGSATVTFAALDTGVTNTKYEWWYNAYVGDGNYWWVKVEDHADTYNVTGYDTYKMTIHGESENEKFYLMEGQVKCKFINADTNEVIVESPVVTIRHSGHALNEPCQVGSTQTDHYIRCRSCQGISTLHEKHSYRWIYNTRDNSKVSHVCSTCGYVDVYNKNTTLPKVDSTCPARITLNSNDDTFTKRNVSGSTYEKVDLNKYAFVRPGQIQIGWAFNSEAKVPDYSMDDKAIMDGFYDLYAVWKPIETILKLDLINGFDFCYGGKGEFNDGSLENDDAFILDYFDGKVEFQWIRYNADGTRVLIGNDEVKYYPASAKEDIGNLYAGSLIQLRIIDGDRMFISHTFPFDADKQSAPVITSQPEDQTAAVGEKVSFKVAATGEGLSYQWEYKNKTATEFSPSSAAVAKTAELSFVVGTDSTLNGRQYRCVVTDKNGNSVTSEIATLTVGTITAGPVITTQPADQTAVVGEKVTFTVAATGEGLKYQWKKSTDGGKTWPDSSSTGATTDTLSMTTKESYNGLQFKCVVTDKYGKTVESKAATLTVVAAGTLAITTQPKDVAAAAGQEVVFTVKAIGEGLKYQWKKSKDGGKTWPNSSSTGATTDTLTMTMQASYNGLQFKCIVTDAKGESLETKAVTLTLSTGGIEPKILTPPPTGISALSGNIATIQIKAEGEGLKYQWQKSTDGGKTWANSSSTGATTNTLSMTTKASFSGLKFRCIVTDKNGKSVTSSATTLTVTAAGALAITTQPANATVAAGANVTFKIAATGDTLKYQWKKSTDGGKTWVNSSSTGATTNTLTMATKATFNGYKFKCVVTDKNGKTVTSNAATLTVTAAGALTITSQPADAIVLAGTTAIFKITATGDTLKYQWKKSTDGGKTWVNSSSTGATTNTLSMATKASYDGLQFKCVVTDKNGKTVTSNVATLKITSSAPGGVTAPAITTQPSNVTVTAGATATFKIAATGTGLKYQWKKSTDGGKTWVNSSSTGATSNTLSMTTKASFNNLKFKCVVTDVAGVIVESNAATLTVK